MAAAPAVVLLAAYLGISFAAASALWATWDTEATRNAVLSLLERISSGSSDEVALGRQELLSFAQGTLTSAGLAAQAQAAGGDVEELRRELEAARAGLTAPGEVPAAARAPSSTPAQEGQEGALAALGNTLSGVLGGVGAGSLALALSSAFTQTAEDREHNALGARYKSQSGFPQALFDQVARFLPTIAAGGFVFAQDDMRNLMFGNVEAFLDSQLDPSRFPGPASEENAQELAAQRLQEAVSFGRQAALLALSLETLTPMKQMGFSQYAGLLASFAGFDRISAGLMGTVENAAIYQPLRWRANRRFRPMLPNSAEVSGLYAKKELTPSQLADYLAKAGVPELFIARASTSAFRDLGLGEVVRVAQFFQTSIAPAVAQAPGDVLLWWGEREEWVDIFARVGVGKDVLLGKDWYFYYKLSKAGYEPVDVVVLTEVAKRATSRRELMQAMSIASRLYRDGFISDGELIALVDEAWAFTNPKAARVRVAQLQAQYQDMAGYRDLVLRSISRGILSKEVGRQKLLAAGMRPQRVELELLGERLNVLPRVSVAEGTEAADFLEEVGV